MTHRSPQRPAGLEQQQQQQHAGLHVMPRPDAAKPAPPLQQAAVQLPGQRADGRRPGSAEVHATPGKQHQPPGAQLWGSSPAEATKPPSARPPAAALQSDAPHAAQSTAHPAAAPLTAAEMLAQAQARADQGLQPQMQPHALQPASISAMPRPAEVPQAAPVPQGPAVPSVQPSAALQTAPHPQPPWQARLSLSLDYPSAAAGSHACGCMPCQPGIERLQASAGMWGSRFCDHKQPLMCSVLTRRAPLL